MPEASSPAACGRWSCRPAPQGYRWMLDTGSGEWQEIDQARARALVAGNFRSARVDDVLKVAQCGVSVPVQLGQLYAIPR